MSLDYRQDEPEVETAEEEREYNRVAPRFTLYSYILIAAIAAVFAAQFYFDGRIGPEASILVGGFNGRFVRAGEYWRILTSAALHGGFIHLAFNSYAIYVLGRQFEIMSARAHLAIVFLLSAIGGYVPALLMRSDGWSVGASGGIVGFLGYLTVYSWKRRELISSAFRQSMIFNIGLMLFFGISMNASGGTMRVDNWAHLGGLATGALYGLFQISGDIYKNPLETSKTVSLIGSAALGVYLLTCAVLVIEFVR